MNQSDAPDNVKHWSGCDPALGEQHEEEISYAEELDIWEAHCKSLPKIQPLSPMMTAKELARKLL